MSRSVLVVTWDGAGNLPPERAIIRALGAAGHTVRVLAHESVRGAIEEDGAELLPVRGARHYDSSEAMAPADEMPFVLEHIWFATAFGTALQTTVERLRPDVLLVDVCLAHALVAARASRVPTAVLGHFPYHLLLGPYAPVVAPWMPGVNAYAAELGLPPFPSLQALIEWRGPVLIPTYRAFDEVEHVAPNVVHVGPLRSRERGTAWARRLAGRPLVVVGLSTSNQNQAGLLQRLCDALGGLDVEALVTTGAAIAPESLRAAANTTVMRFVTHDAVLPSADLLVTHAGHGTVMAGITYGVPMLCLPMGRDQPMIADRVARLGLGTILAPEAPVAEIGRAITATLGDAGLAARARAFAHSVAGHPGLDEALGLIDGMLAGRA